MIAETKKEARGTTKKLGSFPLFFFFRREQRCQRVKWFFLFFFQGMFGTVSLADGSTLLKKQFLFDVMRIMWSDCNIF